MKNDEIFAGLMSGTSLDGVDALLVHFADNQQVEILERASHAFEPHLRQRLLSLAASDEVRFVDLALAEQQLTEAYAQCSLELQRKQPHLQPCALGCHGQTLEHRPEQGYSLQLLNPSLLAELSGHHVICDFRRRDLAAGGQGAPLAPAFHLSQMHSPKEDRIIINLGGIANISWLPAADKSRTLGFDTGPANILLDAWCSRNLGHPFDHEGSWAASGRVDNPLLQALLSDSYFTQPPPKSTGRERFNSKWLDNQLDKEFKNLNPADIQATLAELTAKSLADAILQLDPHYRSALFVCGGGAFNRDLIERIGQHTAPRPLTTTSSLGIPPQDVEAAAFAWLARQHWHGQPGNLSSVTGARGLRLLGGFYPSGGRILPE